MARRDNVILFPRSPRQRPAPEPIEPLPLPYPEPACPLDELLNAGAQREYAEAMERLYRDMDDI